MTDQPLVSIVIPTYNSVQQLRICLKSINSQTYQNREIIIVDNYSDDGTEELSKNYNVKFYTLRGERAKAKNFGLSKATGKYILFVDSDMELANDVIKECVMLMDSNHGIGGIIIPETTLGVSFWAKVRAYERRFYENTEIESARFFITSLARKVNGYDEHTVFFEESTLPCKIRKFRYIVNARINSKIFHHEESLSIINHLQKKLYYGRSLSYYVYHYRHQAKIQLNFAYRAKIFFNKKFMEHPMLGMAVFILKFVESFFVLTGAVVSTITGDKSL